MKKKVNYGKRFEGKVENIKKKYGFIKCSEIKGIKIFLPKQEIMQIGKFKGIRGGDEVEFDVVDSENNDGLVALNVLVIMRSGE